MAPQQNQKNQQQKTELKLLEMSQLIQTKASEEPKVDTIQKKMAESPQQKEMLFMKKIKSAQVFFNKKFLGNKDQSKALAIKHLLKIPSQTSNKSNKLIQLKTSNLNDLVKQIQTIFKAQKITKKKKSLMEIPPLSDFQLYLTKRDILKQKNAIIDQLRKEYEEDKKKMEEKKKKKKNRKTSFRESKDEKVFPQTKTQFLPENNSQKQIANYNQNQNILFFPVMQKAEENSKLIDNNPQIPQVEQLLGSQALIIKKILKNKEVFKPYEDEYFQKKFQNNIIKNKIALQPVFSLKSLFSNLGTKKTTLNQDEFIKQELNQIENVAKATIQNFQLKQKINRQVYSCQLEFQKIPSSFSSQRSTPLNLQNQSQLKTKTKSINWVLQECDSFKKRFNIRKSKSLKVMKKNV